MRQLVRAVPPLRRQRHRPLRGTPSSGPLRRGLSGRAGPHRPDYEICQQLAHAARVAGFDCVLAPSAGLPGQRTLAVFAGVLDEGRVVVETERVQVPPINLVKLLPRVRSMPAAAAAFEAYVGDLARLSYESVRRLYRRR